jgi:hypothetical protein
MNCQLIFDKRYCNALERIHDMQKESDYELIKAAGFDSEEIAYMWDDSDDDVESFIEYLNELEVEGHCKMDCQDD